MTNEQITDKVRELLNCPTDYALAARLGVDRRSVYQFKKGDGRSVACVMLAKVLAVVEQPLTAEPERPETD
ncbi:hypothetical protein [Alishewanella longhuensis]